MHAADDSSSDRDLSDVLTSAAALLSTDAAGAASHAYALLAAMPGQQQALALLADAKACTGDLAGLREILRSASARSPNLSALQFELGEVHAALDETAAAITALSRAVALEPAHPTAWRSLGDIYARAARPIEARAAYARHHQSAVQDLKLLEDASSLGDADPQIAETMLREYLKIHPTDVSVLYLLARFYMSLGRYEEAEEIYAQALLCAPEFTTARYNYALSLYHQTKAEQTIAQTDLLLRDDPGNLDYRALKATALGLVGEYDQAIAWREALLQDEPNRAAGWLKYGHLLRITGRIDAAIAAYRKSIELRPDFGEAYWSFSNLKTFQFGDDDIGAMRSALQHDALSADDRLHLHFALGKASEDRSEFARSFAHYRQANALRREELSYDPAQTTNQTRDAKRLFTRSFLRSRQGGGDPDAHPIFIVGLPRSGSTLIEQILSSHSAIEGTSELPDIAIMVRRLDRGRRDGRAAAYPEILADLDDRRRKALGAEYLARTQIHRKTARPFFIDKTPGNFRHIGFIQLILPNARIIDARRDPIGCGFSIFKQHFASGVRFGFNLGDIGRYYRDYVELMAHFDAVLPGRVHRVFYDGMIRDPEREIRRLLDYCGVPFEAACLSFHANARSVMTPSSQQVRRPIYADALAQWRPFEPWLDPLKAALGPVLDIYPDVPAFDIPGGGE